jgi:archaellum component FlaF (FlaF/FlaG flagellin family)
MDKGQVSFDMILALMLFIFALTLFFYYVNDLDANSKLYNSNVNNFNEYILAYSAFKSVDTSDVNINYDFSNNVSFNSSDKNLIIDENNNYIINLVNKKYTCTLNNCKG